MKAFRGVRLVLVGLVGVDPLVRACLVPVQAVVGIELVVVEKDMPIELLRCQTSPGTILFQMVENIILLRWKGFETI